ncbi:MAG: hypothetical protein M3N57_12480, partial [Actinomycetota bacterium]|nr:hypothetical protein [Actinomycetota bacterium]
MSSGVAIPLHLAVHILGFTVSVGLAAYAIARRDDAESGWLSFAAGGALVAVSHAVSGALVSGGPAWPSYIRAAGYAALAVGAAG